MKPAPGVIAVSKESGKVVWHAGPEVAQQHTPVEMENGSILVFDNGNLRPGVTSPHSTVLEFNPQTHAITWQYRDIFPPAFFSPYMGSAQRLANGKHLYL